MAYYAAAKTQDGEAIYKLMTPEWKQKARSWKKSFTKNFLDGTIALKSYKIKKESQDETGARVSTITVLRIGDKEKGESMHFKLIRNGDDGWLIAKLN